MRFRRKASSQFSTSDSIVWRVCPHKRGNAPPNCLCEHTHHPSVKMDYERKRKLYQESGVEEYWIVDPDKEQVSVYRFQKNDQVKVSSFRETVKVGIYEDFKLDLEELKEYLEG